MYLLVISTSSFDTCTALGSAIDVCEVYYTPEGYIRICGLLMLPILVPGSFGLSAIRVNLRLQSCSVKSMASTAEDGSRPSIGL